MGLSDPLLLYFSIFLMLVKKPNLEFLGFIQRKKKENWQKMEESYQEWKKTLAHLAKVSKNDEKAHDGETYMNWRKSVINGVSHLNYLVGAPPNSENKLLD